MQVLKTMGPQAFIGLHLSLSQVIEPADAISHKVCLCMHVSALIPAYTFGASPAFN